MDNSLNCNNFSEENQFHDKVIYGSSLLRTMTKNFVYTELSVKNIV